MTRVVRITVAAILIASATWSQSADAPFRPPAVPLIAVNPNFSVWSMADKLTDDTPRHWTRREHPLSSLIRIDGKPFRLMGKSPPDVPALPQTGVQVTPTRSIYSFENPQVHVTLTFTTPSLPDDIDVLARPMTYLVWQVKSIDGAQHAVSIFDSTSALLSVNTPTQKVVWARETFGGLTALHAGTEDQPLLRPAGDDTRVDWGYVYAAASSAQSKSAIGSSAALLKSFVDSGALPQTDDTRMPRAANDDEPALAFSFDLGNVAAEPVSRHVIVAYDEIYAIKFLGQKLRPFWRRDGAGPGDLLQACERDLATLTTRCEAFDKEMLLDLTKEGGVRYAQIGALAYRQALAGCGLAADANKMPMLFTKENSSNGCIATVDVIYPAAPQFLLMGSLYAKALVAPAMVYSTSPQWRFHFAPHDVGVYPQANGRVYGGDADDPKNEGNMMPVEESANMILLVAAIAKMDGNANYATQYWKQLTYWVDYLEKHGKDPENQLCTDDFMGHLAHNSNLAVKAILGIAAYGELCRMRGDNAAYEKYFAIARDYAKHWTEVAADGDHYRIAYDKPNTWSQKYNLVWDKLLGLRIFPPEVARKEVAFYKTKVLKYGLPLDSRTHLSKTDWSVWCATLADNQADFEAIVSPIYDYLNDTTARLPFVDSYITDDKKSDGMRARPVIGGVFVKMLEEPAMWKKWAGRCPARANNWAPVPVPPVVEEIVNTSRRQPQTWRYTTQKPPGAPASSRPDAVAPTDWTQPGFDDSAWKQGPGGFGTSGTPGITVGTTWNTADIWIRREVTLPEKLDAANLQLLVFHDEDVEVYIDGILAAKEQDFITTYEPMEISATALARLKPGAKIVLAAHCHQTTGGQGVDIGIASVTSAER
ncbi:MAG TPA: DUF4965 domain-containing protein [Planctomycetota bacterium]|nr:DUF4965 domain-containing protein [Planctomycetota bacterium]